MNLFGEPSAAWAINCFCRRGAQYSQCQDLHHMTPAVTWPETRSTRDALQLPQRSGKSGIPVSARCPCIVRDFKRSRRNGNG